MDDRFDTAIAVFALGSTVGSLLQWKVMSGQLAEMKSGSADTHRLAVAANIQADASKLSADTAVKQLERTDSPIIRADIVSEGATGASDGMTFPFRVTIVNSGRSAASGVRIVGSQSYDNVPGASAAPQLVKDCADADKMAEGVPIQPSQGFTVELMVEFTTRDIQIHRQIPPIAGDFFSPTIEGCVAYSIPYSSRLHHHRFAEDVFRRGKNGSQLRTYELGVNVPPSDVFLLPNLFTNTDPD